MDGSTRRGRRQPQVLLLPVPSRVRAAPSRRNEAGTRESEAGLPSAHDRLDEVKAPLASALTDLYYSLDEQLKMIADAKAKGTEPGVQPKPGVDQPPPVGIGGKYLRPWPRP